MDTTIYNNILEKLENVTNNINNINKYYNNNCFNNINYLEQLNNLINKINLISELSDNLYKEHILLINPDLLNNEDKIIYKPLLNEKKIINIFLPYILYSQIVLNSN